MRLRLITIVFVALSAMPLLYAADEQKELLVTREAVWRAWCSNDRAALEKLLPADTIAINAGEKEWQGRAAVLESAAAFAKSGGKLLSLKFPRTETQRYGDVAVLYSLYEMELETATGKASVVGRVTEVFVRRDGRWLNSGWHMDSGD